MAIGRVSSCGHDVMRQGVYFEWLDECFPGQADDVNCERFLIGQKRVVLFWNLWEMRDLIWKYGEHKFYDEQMELQLRFVNNNIKKKTHTNNSNLENSHSHVRCHIGIILVHHFDVIAVIVTWQQGTRRVFNPHNSRLSISTPPQTHPCYWPCSLHQLHRPLPLGAGTHHVMSLTNSLTPEQQPAVSTWRHVLFWVNILRRKNFYLFFIQAFADFQLALIDFIWFLSVICLWS